MAKPAKPAAKKAAKSKSAKKPPKNGAPMDSGHMMAGMKGKMPAKMKGH